MSNHRSSLAGKFSKLAKRIFAALVFMLPITVVSLPQPAAAAPCQIWGYHIVCGAIADKYIALGGWGWGYPTTHESTTPDGAGWYNHFNEWVSGVESTASIYYTHQTGAVKVNGAIRDKWAAMGWEQSVVGYPVSDEDISSSPVPQRFQRGMIVWSPQRGALEVHGAIYDTWYTKGYAFVLKAVT